MVSKKKLARLVALLEQKCGGPGGRPGPCPGARRNPPAAGKKPPKKKPPKKPRTFEELGTQIGKHHDKIEQSRQKILELSMKLGFKPTSKEPFAAQQQAIEWTQQRLAQRTVEKAGTTKPTKPAKPAKPEKPAKPPKEPKPAPKPGKKPPKKPTTEQKPAEKPPSKPSRGRKPKPTPNTTKPSAKPAEKPTAADPVTEAKAVVAMGKIPKVRQVKMNHEALRSLKPTSKVAEIQAAVKSAGVNGLYVNRGSALKQAVKIFKENFTDDKAEQAIQAAKVAVKKFFTRDGAAARILSHLKENMVW